MHDSMRHGTWLPRRFKRRVEVQDQPSDPGESKSGAVHGCKYEGKQHTCTSGAFFSIRSQKTSGLLDAQVVTRHGDV